MTPAKEIPTKLTKAQKELLLNLQGGALLMWSYRSKCFWRFCGKGFTVVIASKPADALIHKGFVEYKGEGRHEGEKVARYQLTELGKTIEL